jgi:hypothetical protein
MTGTTSIRHVFAAHSCRAGQHAPSAFREAIRCVAEHWPVFVDGSYVDNLDKTVIEASLEISHDRLMVQIAMRMRIN